MLRVPLGGRRDEVAIRITRSDVCQNDRRHLARLVNAATLAAYRAFAFHFPEQGFERDFCGAALDAEGTPDVALAGFARPLRDKGRDLFFRRQNRILLR